ncbi:UNVERIFIED_CONTAM: hypothetical protein Sradi_7278100, partial [Sesamum radiatum]
WSFTKKQKLANGYTTKPCTSNKEPSLLKKLLNSDIERDKKHLLQVFRFMVMNSFFGDWPEKPLKFPVVVVKEPGDVSELVEEPKAAEGDTPDGNSPVCTGNFKNSSHGGVDAPDKNAASCGRIYALLKMNVQNREKKTKSWTDCYLLLCVTLILISDVYITLFSC